MKVDSSKFPDASLCRHDEAGLRWFSCRTSPPWACTRRSGRWSTRYAKTGERRPMSVWSPLPDLITLPLRAELWCNVSKWNPMELVPRVSPNSTKEIIQIIDFWSRYHLNTKKCYQKAEFL
jgi:hypothetical protein